jgi:UDP-glucose 4-epimerase
MKNKRVLVTGGAGFIGSHLVDLLLETGNSVYVVDDLSSGRAENLNKNAVFIRGSVADRGFVDSVMRKGVDYVFHLAARPSITESLSNPLLSIDANIKGTANVARGAADAGVEKIVFSSSSSVYGPVRKLPVSERLPFNPQTPYSVTKVAGELYCKTAGLRSTCLRYFNVYGPRQRPQAAYSAVVPCFFDALAAGKGPTIFSTGEQTCDFVFVKDVARANVLAAESRKADGLSINVGSGKETSINALWEGALRLYGGGIEPVRKPGERKGVTRSRASIALAKKALGFSPEFTLESGLLECFNKWPRKKR